MIFIIVRELTKLLIDFVLLRVGGKKIILWTHLGLGDQIAAAKAIEVWSSQFESVHIPVQEKYVEVIRMFYGYLNNVTFHPVPNLPEIFGPAPDTVSGVRKLREIIDCRVVDAGRYRYEMLSRIYPTIGLNQVLHLCLGVKTDNSFSGDFSDYAYSLRETAVLKSPYAFVDHHPGTFREIPAFCIQELESSGLEIVLNGFSIDFLDLPSLLRNAKELHMVPSAPLCLALTLGLRNTRSIHYRPNGYRPLHTDGSIGNWIDFPTMKGKEIEYGPSKGDNLTTFLKKTGTWRFLSRSFSFVLDHLAWDLR